MNLRLPEELDRRLRERARRDGVSLRAEIVLALWESRRIDVADLAPNQHQNGTNVVPLQPQNGPIVVPEPEKRKKFVPPTRQEALEYYRLMGYHFDLDDWFAYYEALGWVPKGSKVQMKSWQAAMRLWESNWKRDQQKQAGAENPFGKIPPPMVNGLEIKRRQMREARERGDIE